MISTTTLTLVDGVRVLVPDSLELITPYVLREQQDWFEDEIKFLRRLLLPGQKAIDIGANYGVYTLSMAQAVGPSGNVWAFEPAAKTARLLADSIASNGFTQVTLERRALSSVTGVAQLSVSDHAELNAIVHDSSLTGATETVPLTTLDDCMREFCWRDIEFLKIDAEGEEANILQGGARFLAELSPLIQYEVKAGNDLHLELVQRLAALGYQSYRLIPGLNVLAPFDATTLADGYLLNLFAAKPDCAARLAVREFLAEPTNPSTSARSTFASIAMHNNEEKYQWRNSLARLPYAKNLAAVWEQVMAGRTGDELDQALSYYALSQDVSMTAQTRFAALEISFNRFNTLCEREPSFLRLASLARVAQEFGARMVAVKALQTLVDRIFKQKEVDPSEPFLPPSRPFDSIASGDAIGNWALAAALEAVERLAQYSSFYAGVSGRQRLEIIQALGFGSAEMERRLRLVQQRFRLPA